MNNNLFAAIKQLDVSHIKRCLNSGADPNKKINDFTPINKLVTQGYVTGKSIEIFKLLVDAGANVYNELLLICKSPYLDYLKCVLGMNLNLYKDEIIDDGYSMSLLYACFSYGTMNHINMLTDKYNINYSFIDSDGNNILHYIVMNDETFNIHILHLKISFLLTKNVNINIKNNEGETPYDIAIKNLNENTYSSAMKYAIEAVLTHIKSFQ